MSKSLRSAPAPAVLSRAGDYGERRFPALSLALVLAVLSGAGPAHARGGKVHLARKYRQGQEMVYQTQVETNSTVRSTPPGLRSFLPPVPTRVNTRQQTTVKVRAVHADGTAEIESRFDRFELESDLPDYLAEEIQDSTREAQEEFSRRLNGQTLIARYDRQGRLLDFQGAEEMLAELEPPLRDTLQEVLRLFLEQMGGNALYPERRVKPGEEWKRKLGNPPSAAYPYTVEGESTLRYVGKTRFGGVKAAIIDFEFTNVLRPALEQLRQEGPLAELEAEGMGLDMQIDGQGRGRVLVALDDGRVLQNHATLLQTLTARLQGLPGVPLPTSEPVTLQVESETRLEMDGSGKNQRAK